MCKLDFHHFLQSTKQCDGEKSIPTKSINILHIQILQYPRAFFPSSKTSNILNYFSIALVIICLVLTMCYMLFISYLI